jgi:thiamine-phosphate pyrophosphorylase
LLLYYITDRTQFPGSEGARRHSLLEKIGEAARCGVDFIQLREKDLSTRELEALARAVVRVVRENSQQRTESSPPATALLINSRTDVAFACGADGVHLRSDDILPSQAREVWTQGARSAVACALISVSCHSTADVAHAASEGADLALFGPVFQKRDAPNVRPASLEGLREACQEKIPVLALGGITPENARDCLDAGAAGIAAIRLFQQNDVAQVVRSLRP